MEKIIFRKEGSKVFGRDVDTYRRGRLAYPPEIYQLIADYTTNHFINNVFEVGPGTGQATEKFLKKGFSVTAIEPDKHFSEYLQTGLCKEYPNRLSVVNNNFEDVKLLPASFELGAAATSWHWVEPLSGSAKAFGLLRPGGCFAIWWNIFENKLCQDEFQYKTGHLFDKLLYSSPSRGENNLPYGMQKEARLEELYNAGFTDVKYKDIDWQIEMSAEQTIDLISTFSPVIKLDELKRKTFLGEIEQVVNHSFGGTVARNFKSVLYLCRKPFE